MLGDIIEIRNNLWMVEGKLPEHCGRDINPANALVYLRDKHLYIIDTGAGSVMRKSLLNIIRNQIHETVILINTHAHLDHICNNDLLRYSDAQRKYHYIASSPGEMINAESYFADHLMDIERYTDPFKSYATEKPLFRMAAVLRDILSIFIGRFRAYRTLMKKKLGSFKPRIPSVNTMTPLENDRAREIEIAGTEWTGWIMGDNDMYLLEERGHSSDEILVYIPEYKHMHLADLTFPLFPAWPDCNVERIRNSIRKVIKMIRKGSISTLSDAHIHNIIHDSGEGVLFLEECLLKYETLRNNLFMILKEKEGQTISQLYDKLIESAECSKVISNIIQNEYPRTPVPLMNVILYLLIEEGCRAEGEKRNMKFYLK